MEANTKDKDEIVEAALNVTMEKLAQLGYRPEIDKDGDIIVRKEGVIMFFGLRQVHSNYYELIALFPDKSQEEAHHLAASVITQKMRVIKVIDRKEGGVCFSIESFHASPTAFADCIEMYLVLMLAGIKRFNEACEEITKDYVSMGVGVSELESRGLVSDDADLVV